MSEPDNARWLNDLSDELRADVPVRPAWRARLLDEIAREPRPATVRVDDTATATRRIVIGPVTAIAAALTFAAVGAGAALGITAWRARATAPVASTPAPATPTQVVRFELAAPTATHVALVGSFNRWNPISTPLTRDKATGKWVVALRLPAGRHVYAFVVDGDVTADPTAPQAADADFGSANSVVLVSGRSS